MNEPRTHISDEQNGNDHPSPGSAFREAIAQLAEFKEYALHYIVARLDGLKISIRNTVVLAAIGVLTLLGSFAVLVTAIVMFCVGLSQWLSVMLGGRMWAGNLIVGVLLIAGLVIGIWLGVKHLFGASLTKTVERYERKLRRQRIDLGHDARERSAEYDAE